MLMLDLAGPIVRSRWGRRANTEQAELRFEVRHIGSGRP
jgi:hypothetical protein